ncbi:PREDICTED: beta-1,3-glucosyltransferase, partial [Nicrophorus vespilloides]|uniref:Beta-1,3-glucosyltransferase n=1 Tax=Nicrophorus vespilloides TaxID=110193 RepID=A0ABM1MH73_NICVS
AEDVVFVILSQPNPYHLARAQELKNNIQAQSKDQFVVHLSHLDFPHAGGWTIIPLIPQLSRLHGSNSSFIVFLEDGTRVRLGRLLDTLRTRRGKDEVFLGYALHDREPSIIHHFAFYEDPTSFKYPNLASGFAISTALLLRLNERLRRENMPKTDFNIDSVHEFSLFVWNDGAGVALSHDSSFCVADEGEACATHVRPFESCGDVAPRGSIYFAVKTCSKFHEDRVPIVKKTWAKHAAILRFFSDVEDDTVPTVTLGVANTEHGHCEKTFSILRYINREIENRNSDIRWIFIADDDTILSVSGLRALLGCYDSGDAVALGERYGYGMSAPGAGYDYITGGGGIAISRPLLSRLALNCSCPTASAPDDMYMGLCLKEIGTVITHSPLFHQARPMDYAEAYLRSYSAVSFHKHWMVDPIKVYNSWFAYADTVAAHTEL